MKSKYKLIRNYKIDYINTHYLDNEDEAKNILSDMTKDLVNLTDTNKLLALDSKDNSPKTIEIIYKVRIKL